MGTVKEEQERVRNLLLDTVTLLCKNGLTFKKHLKVQGLLGITMDEDNVFIVHINEQVGEIMVEHQKEHKKQNDICADNSRGSKDTSIHRPSPEKRHSRKRSSTSSPVFKGPPEKVKVKTEHFDDDLVLIDEDKSNIPKITGVSGTATGIQGAGFNNPNTTGEMNEFGQYNPNQYTGMPSAFVTGVVPNATQQADMSQGVSAEKLPLASHHKNLTWHSARPMGFLKSRRDKTASIKDFTCPYPRCVKNYYDKRSLVRHCRKKHNMSYQETAGRLSEVESLNDEQGLEVATDQSCGFSQELLVPNNANSSVELTSREDINLQELQAE